MADKGHHTSEDALQVSGEINADNPRQESREQRESKEPAPEEKRAARIFKYKELLPKAEAELTATREVVQAEYSEEAIEAKAQKAYETAIGKSGMEMAGRLRDATRATQKEKRDFLIGNAESYVEGIKTNIAKLEAGQDDLYSEH